MKLRIDDITAEGREVCFAEPEQEINRALVSGPLHEYVVKPPLRVSLSYYRAGSEIFVSGTLEAVTTAACSRCAEEFDLPSYRHFRYVLAAQAMGDRKTSPFERKTSSFPSTMATRSTFLPSSASKFCSHWLSARCAAKNAEGCVRNAVRILTKAIVDVSSGSSTRGLGCCGV